MKTLAALLVSLAILLVILTTWVGIPFAFGALVVWLGAPKWVGGIVGIVIFLAFLFSNRLKNGRS